MSMTYEAFEQTVLENIRQYLPEEYASAEVSIISTMKLGKTYRAISVMLEDQEIGGISVSLPDLYERYQMEGDLEKVISGVFNDLLKNGVRRIHPFLSAYENVRDRLFIRLSNEERNRELLKEVPHTMFQDLAITYHILISRDSDGISSTMITNALLERYGVAKKQLHEDALRSSAELFPPLYENSMEFIAAYMRGKIFPKEDRRASNKELNVLTNEAAINGAAVIVYPGVAEEIAEQLGSSYCIIPSSIHELFIMTYLSFEDLLDFHNLVRHVNQHYVEEEEFLSDNLYVYHRESGKLYTVHFDDNEGCIICRA